MLLALLARRFAQPLARIAARVATAPDGPRTAETVLRDIALRISAGGADTLTKTDTLIWNTAVVVSFMAGDGRVAVPHDAKVLSWGAARAGFREMGRPDLAEFVRLFVLELAYRADLDGRDGKANSASLLRIAELKQRFQRVGSEVNFPLELSMLAERERNRT